MGNFLVLKQVNVPMNFHLGSGLRLGILFFNDSRISESDRNNLRKDLQKAFKKLDPDNPAIRLHLKEE